MSKVETYIFTFLCYTSIHALRTSYSQSKAGIAKDIQIPTKWMGIPDALMLLCLGIGHFTHAINPIKKPVTTLWISMMLCGIVYAAITICMSFKPLASIYTLSILMSINGYLQSYSWPNLLMLVHSKFRAEKYPELLGFWATNTNFGNIIGYLIFQILFVIQDENWDHGLNIAAIYAFINGLYIALNFDELPVYNVENSETIVQKQIQEEHRGEDLQKYLINPQQGEKSIVEIKIPQNISAIQQKQETNDLKLSFRETQQIINKIDDKTQTALSIKNLLSDTKFLLLTATFALSKSVIYGIMLWLPLYFKQKQALKDYRAEIPIAYDISAIFGSVALGFCFKKFTNKTALMIPFMVAVFISFFMLRFIQGDAPSGYFILIAIIGFCLGGTFNTLSGLVVISLTNAIPQNLKTSSLGFYSALTMAVGNFTTAFTQILFGFVIGKQNPSGIFLIFMIYAAVCLICLIMAGFLEVKHNTILITIQEPILNDGAMQEDQVEEKQSSVHKPSTFQKERYQASHYCRDQLSF